MPKKLTLDEIKNRLKNKNPNIEIISDKYINSTTKLKCKCNLDGYEWDVTWDALRSGNGCPKCSNHITLTINEVKEKLSKINPNIKILSDIYINTKTKLKCKCLVDNYEWSTIWSTLQAGYGCPECSGNRRDYTIEIIREKLHNINPNIKILSDIYKSCDTKLECECLICDNIWFANWDSLKQEKGCPNCKIINHRTPLGEIVEYVHNINPNIEILDITYIKDVKYRTITKCKCKIDDHEWTTRLEAIKKGRGCPECWRKKNSEIHSKERHLDWKGGITPLNNYLRNFIKGWNYDISKKYNRRCFLTNKISPYIQVHHIYPFSKILEDTLDELHIDIRPQINKYSDFELELIEKEFLKRHTLDIGVPLLKEIHIEFHKIYGKNNNTTEQWDEFVHNFKEGKIHIKY